MGKRSRQRHESQRTPSPASPPSASASTSRSANASADGSRSSLLPVALAFILAVAVLAIYAQVRTHAFINFDDPDYVTKNEHVVTGLSASNIAWAFTHFHSSNWHPLTWVSHMADVQLFGLDAGKHALTSVVLHAINSVLLFFILRRTTRRTWPSAVVAGLFALHPLRVESVAWISERKDVLCAFFFFWAIWFYVGPSDRSPGAVGRGWRAALGPEPRIWLTLAMFACALMSKPMAITLPFVLLLLDWWPLGRWSPRDWPALKPLAIEKWPLFLLIPISALITSGAQQEAMTPLALPFRLANAALSYVAYLGKALWPAHLAAFYPYRTVMPLGLAVAAFALLIAITVAVWLVRERFPYLVVGWFWYLGTMVPVIGIVQVGQQSMADRYTYLPLIGIAIAVVWLAAELVRNRIVLTAAAVLALAGCGVLTYRQTGYWRDSTTLFTHAIEVAPRGRIGHINLGAAYLERLDYATAASQFRAALAISERDDLAHNGLGVALAGTGDVDGARREYTTAMSLNPKNPEPYRNLGKLELASGAPEKAIPLLEKANAIKSDEATRGALATARGHDEEAIAHYRRAVELDPNAADVRNDFAALLARREKDAEALDQYEAALKIAPDNYDVHMNVGALLSRMGRNDEAARHFAAAGNARPKSTEPHVYLALLYANMGRLQEAIREVRTAGSIDPAAANQQFTNAVHIAFKPTNLEEYLGFLEQRAAGRG